MNKSSQAGGNCRRKRKGRRPCLKEAPDSLVYMVVKYLFGPNGMDEKLSVVDVAKEISRYPEYAYWEITRERIYLLVEVAIERGYLVPTPPREQVLSERMTDLYSLHGKHRRTIDVVNASGKGTHDDVCVAAARTVHTMIRKLAAERKNGEIHIGMAVGQSTKKVADNLGTLLRSAPCCPNFVVHGLSPLGFSTTNSQLAPNTFTDSLRNGTNKVEYVHVNAPSVVRCSDYETTRSSCAVRDAFDCAQKIDILVTAFACADHEHGVYSNYLQLLKDHGETEKLLKEQGWIGDVNYLPYSETGPIMLEQGLRSFVLFEIPELVELANAKAKDIVLVGGPCSKCGLTRANALRPLIRVPSLRMWTHLVTDIETACELLRQAA